MNNSQNKTMDEIICDLSEVVLGALNVSNNLRTLNEKEFAGDDGEDVTDKLPSMTEALKLRETMNEIKKIYEWAYPGVGDEGFIDAVKEREEIFKKYYGDNEDIKEKYEKLQEENEKLKHRDDVAELRYKSVVGRLEAENEKLRSDDKYKGLEALCAQYDKEAVELRAQIPDKKNKKLSKNDKMILHMIDNDLFAFEEAQPDDEDYLPGGMSYLYYPEKKALIKRLLK